MRRWYLVLVAVWTFVGTVPLVVRRVDLPSPAIAAGRVWVGAVALGVWVAVRPRREGTERLLAHRPRLTLAVGVLLAAHWLALFEAYRRIPPSTVILVVYLAPVVIAGLAPRLLGERLGPPTLAALALGLAGFVLVTRPSVVARDRVGLGLAVFAAASYAAIVLASKPLAEAYGGQRLAFLQMSVAGVAIAPVAIATDWGRPERAWLWLVVLGVAHTAVAHGLYLTALERVPATHAGVLGYVEPVAVVVWSAVFLDEAIGWRTVAGGAFIVAAGMLVMSVRATEEVDAGVPR